MTSREVTNYLAFTYDPGVAKDLGTAFSDELLTRLTRVGEVHYAIRPDGAGRIVMRHWDFDAMVDPDTPTEPHPPFIGDLLARVVGVLPALAGARAEAVRIAVRPMPGDNLPVIGPVPGAEGLYAIVGHGAITHGPLVARLAAREVAHGEHMSELDPYRPDRIVRPIPSSRIA